MFLSSVGQIWRRSSRALRSNFRSAIVLLFSSIESRQIIRGITRFLENFTGFPSALLKLNETPRPKFVPLITSSSGGGRGGGGGGILISGVMRFGFSSNYILEVVQICNDPLRRPRSCHVTSRITSSQSFCRTFRI